MRNAITCTLLILGVALALLASLGVAAMPKALPRLHFSAIVASFSVGLITLAVWIADTDWQARLKMLVIAIVLFAANSILSHSTARAIRIHQEKRFAPGPGERVAIITPENPSGASE